MATVALYFILLWHFLPCAINPLLMVMILAKYIALACLVQATSRVLGDGCLHPPSTTNSAPPAPYLASSLSSPYLKYTSIWMYRTWWNLCWMGYKCLSLSCHLDAWWYRHLSSSRCPGWALIPNGHLYPLSHFNILGMPLKPWGKFPCHHGFLLHHGFFQM